MFPLPHQTTSPVHFWRKTLFGSSAPLIAYPLGESNCIEKAELRHRKMVQPIFDMSTADEVEASDIVFDRFLESWMLKIPDGKCEAFEFGGDTFHGFAHVAEAGVMALDTIG